jgi:hypothetical protein
MMPRMKIGSGRMMSKTKGTPVDRSIARRISMVRATERGKATQTVPSVGSMRELDRIDLHVTGPFT